MPTAVWCVWTHAATGLRLRGLSRSPPNELRIHTTNTWPGARTCTRPAPQGWLSAAEVEDQEHAELDADGRQLLAWVLALMGGVAAVAFTLGYVSASMGLL